LAGYRAGFVTGDPALVGELLELRKHAGLIVPAPVQAAMTAAFGCDAAADALRERYAARRAALWTALENAGWLVEQSGAGLYLWARHPAMDGWQSVKALAARGILVAPGAFYGPSGGPYIRVALTATDERISAAVTRLAAIRQPAARP
jgi:aspartate/methionine/tyrosine aminotransferase